MIAPVKSSIIGELEEQPTKILLRNIKANIEKNLSTHKVENLKHKLIPLNRLMYIDQFWPLAENKIQILTLKQIKAIS